MPMEMLSGLLILMELFLLLQAMVACLACKALEQHLALDLAHQVQHQAMLAH